MCGLAGFINGPEDADALLRKMTDAIRHRGPDGEGHWHEPGAALGHRRLAVIDLAGGVQPMFNEDASVVVVFNGEIYNYLELRAFLLGRGHTLRTRCDTEVLVHLYEEYAERMPEYLSGMFAFALFDRKRRTLFLGRDRLGKKPLLYFQAGSQLVFGSEFSALKAHTEFPAELNTAALGDYLSLQYIPQPETAFQHVKKLPPAHTLVFDAHTGSVRLRRYWSIDYGKKLDLSLEDAAKELRKKVTESVRRRLMAEVPNGAFLSGGIDSTILCGLMAQLRAPQETEAFTIGFEDPAYDERDTARQAAAHLNTLCGNRLKLNELVVRPGDFELLRTLVKHYGEPYADASMLPTALLCRFAREKLTVCLSGDGADELFGGYERYRFMRCASRFDALPDGIRRAAFSLAAGILPHGGERTRAGRLRRALLSAAETAERRYFRVLDRCPPALKKMLWAPDAPDAARHFLHPFTAKDKTERFLELDLATYLPNDILVKVDIASMLSSLEVRAPFLDHELAEFAAALPLEYKLLGSNRKRILKLAFPDLLPPAILNAPKRGFGVPISRWLRENWRGPAQERLLDGCLQKQNLVHRAALERCFRDHCNERADHGYILFNLLVLEIFLGD